MWCYPAYRKFRHLLFHRLLCCFPLFLSCLVLLSVSLMQESGIRVRETLAKQNLYFRWVIYLGALFSLILFGVYGLNYNAADFIYRGF